mmetsp:Transcript_1470/g.3969  ORF Transcript_1470/g.3969 Transcript_1470/m.3969 type:complete len:446 (-) Transcript_1470:1069-2406(-)
MGRRGGGLGGQCGPRSSAAEVPRGACAHRHSATENAHEGLSRSAPRKAWPGDPRTARPVSGRNVRSDTCLPAGAQKARGGGQLGTWASRKLAPASASVRGVPRVQKKAARCLCGSSLLLLLLLLLLALALAGRLVGRLRVGILGDLPGLFLQVLRLRLQVVEIRVLRQVSSQILHLLLELRGVVGTHLILQLGKLLLDLVGQSLRVVLRRHRVLLPAVRLTHGLRLLHHALHLGIGQAAAGAQGDGLLLAGGLVYRADVDDAVGVDVECDLDLRHAPGRRGDAHEVELAQHFVVRSHLALALEDLDAHLCLVVGRGREDLRLLGRDGGISRDQARENASERLDTQGERRHVEQQDILDVSPQHASLDGGAHRHCLVRVDGLAGILAVHGPHNLADLWHARHAPDKQHLVDLARLHARVLVGVLAGRLRSDQEVVDDALQLGPGHL